MFYDVFEALCKEKGISVTKAAVEIGLSKSHPTAWKKRGLTPKADTLTEISKYFKVPLTLLLRQPPFDSWDRINEDRKKFIAQSGVDETILQIIFGIDPEHPEAASISTFSYFVSQAIKSAAIDDLQNWVIDVNSSFAGKSAGPVLRLKKENPPAVSSEGKYPKKNDLLNETNKTDGYKKVTGDFLILDVGNKLTSDELMQTIYAQDPMRKIDLSQWPSEKRELAEKLKAFYGRIAKLTDDEFDRSLEYMDFLISLKQKQRDQPGDGQEIED